MVSFVRKMPQSMQNMCRYMGTAELGLWPIPVNYRMIGYEYSPGVTRGVPCYYFMSNVNTPCI